MAKYRLEEVIGTCRTLATEAKAKAQESARLGKEGEAGHYDKQSGILEQAANTLETVLSNKGNPIKVISEVQARLSKGKN